MTGTTKPAWMLAMTFIVAACVQATEPEETIEQYAQNPTGCASRTAQWYLETSRLPDAKDILCRQGKSYKLRAQYHGRLAEMASLSDAEKSDHISKTITCLREVKWSQETLFKAGITSCK